MSNTRYRESQLSLAGCNAVADRMFTSGGVERACMRTHLYVDHRHVFPQSTVCVVG